MVDWAERRGFQRVNLDVPLAARLGYVDVRIVEIGVPGARIHHSLPLTDGARRLLFRWEGYDLELVCDVVHTERLTGPEPVLQTGLRFTNAVGQSDIILRRMLLTTLTRRLQSIGAQRLSPGRVIDGDATIRGVDAGFVTFRFEGGQWTRRRIFLPEQPPTGFTVAASVASAEDWPEVCRMYENSDAEGRRLIRLLAELSISEAMCIPPRMD